MLPITQTDTFYNSLTLRHRDTINVAAGGTIMKRRPEECYDFIKNMTAHDHDWDTSAQQSESSSSITSSSDTKIAALKAKMAEINKNLMRVLQVNQQVKTVTPNYEIVVVLIPSMIVQPQLAILKMYMLREPTRGTTKEGTNSSKELTKQVVTTKEFTNFMKTNDAILKNMQTNMTSLINSNLELKNMFGQFMKMNTASSSGSRTLLGNIITNSNEDLKGIKTQHETSYQGPTIPTTSSPPVVKRETEATKDTVHPTTNGNTTDAQPSVVPTESLILNPEPVVTPIIEPIASPDLNFNISFADARIRMPKFGPSIKSLLTNKDKLCELVRTPLNEHCLTVLLRKLLEKLGDPGKFMILCDFPRMDECLALVDLNASINLMPLSVWNKLSLPDLSPMCMTLELVDRLISRPVGVAEDVFVKVGTFHFLADFVVVDFVADPRVPLILERSFLKTEKGMIDVFDGELTLCVGKEAITFNLDQTSRYSANYNDMTANQIDVINMACEEYSQEVLGFSDVISSSNPTPYDDLIVSTTSLTLTPFRNSDFLLEEVDAFLALEDDPTSPEELEIYEAKTDKSSIDEPSEVELKDLPPHLEYAFLEGDDKLPVIIAKDLSVNEKTALITEDFEPAVQHQRRVNPKIHDVIKQEVLKLLDVGLIYPIFDCPWVSPVHCVPKKGGFTIEENEENELIPTRLVTSWRIYIDYQRMLKRCEDTNLCLNWEKSHFMVKKGIVLGHKFSKEGIEVDKAKVDVIAKLPHPTTVKGIRSFQVLGQRQDKHFRPIHYASKTMTEAESNHTTTKKEMLAVVYAFEKFRSYLIMNKSIVYIDHFALKYLFAKKDSKARLLYWVLLLQEFTFK
nr:reverse transcriptase domain-containing protein [Tanacetum cinerariifolium]